MRSPLLFVALLFLTLSNSVRADFRASFFEVQYYYYAYKIQWTSGIPATMGGRCRGAQRLCGFSDFVKALMQDEFLMDYHPRPDDNTHTPSKDQKPAFQTANIRANDNGVDYKVKADTVDSVRFEEGELPRQAALLEQVIKNIEDAVAYDITRVSGADIREAARAVQLAKHNRETNPVYWQTTSNMFRAKHRQIIPYLIHKPTFSPGIMFRATSKNIRKAVRQRRLPASDGDRYLRIIKDFPRELENLSAADGPDWRKIVTHRLILKALEQTLTILRAYENGWETRQRGRTHASRVEEGPTNPQLDTGHAAEDFGVEEEGE